ARYQRAVQALTGQGGWPLTAFLTPDGEVFFGGTYFPPEDNHYGRPGFISVLKQLAEVHRSDRARVAKRAQTIRRHVTESLDEAKGGQVTRAILDAATAQMAGLFDVRYGGFGDAPKFPHPAAADFLLARWHDAREDWTREVVEETLTGMGEGGICDDGDYWTWTPGEIRAALRDDHAFDVIRRVFDVEVPGEMHHDHEKNVLWWKRDPAGDDEWPVLKDALRQLKVARDRRKAPFVDTTPYVNWNAMMASAFLHAGAVLDRPEC